MITIIGGTYSEVVIEPHWSEIYGSGLRGCYTILGLDKDAAVQFHTFLDQESKAHLISLKQLLKNFTFEFNEVKQSLSFHYNHPLETPAIFPRLDTVVKADNHLDVNADKVLMFGMIEGSVSVKANKVVYDPQSPVNPVPFSKTNSSTKELAVVINKREAESMTGTSDITKIFSFFFDQEKADVLVIKMGAKGALVKRKTGEQTIIPVYKTQSVWPIGSGDVFASTFAFYWFKNFTAEEAAARASYATAEYCSTRNYSFSEFKTNSSIKDLVIKEIPNGQVYLAGPFFTFAEKWLIIQVRNALRDFGLKVFSPFHDVGMGLAEDVVEKDIAGIESSSIVFAVVDGCDSGTLFEIGYAVKKGIPVIAFVQKETPETMKMLEGTSCLLINDLTTAVYKTFWTLSSNE